MARNPYKRLLTPHEAMRAIYVDFEGRAGESPALLGSLYFEGRRRSDLGRLVMRHDIIDPHLQDLAGEVQVPGVYRYDCSATSLRAALEGLLRRASNQRRPVVSWSHHEVMVVTEAELSADIVERFVRRFRDGKATARRWRTVLHPDWIPERDVSGRADRLVHYFERIGYEVPTEFGGGSVGETLKRLRSARARGKTWSDLTVLQRQRWRELLMHNFHDCDGLRVVTHRAATELEASLASA